MTKILKKNLISFFCLLLALLLTIISVKIRNIRTLDSRSKAFSNTNGFLETFDGAPTTPQPFTQLMQNTWDVAIHSRDDSTYDQLELMEAHHGPDCSPPLDASGNLVTHHMSGMYEDAVFKCKDHVMTSINAGGYGLIELTPNQLADFSNGEVIIKFDVTTWRSSGRDWWDLWITPYDDNLQLPFNTGAVDLQGVPKRGINIKQVNANGPDTGFMPSVINNFQKTNDFTQFDGYNWWTGYNSFMKVSPKQRTTFELHLSKTHLKFGIPGGQLDEAGEPINNGQDFWWADKDIKALDWDKGVVQFGHHSYNPTKDCNVSNQPGPDGKCLPNTWHWDAVSISNAIPFTMIKGDKRMVTPTNSVVTFNQPAPLNSNLRFSGIGIIQVSFDGGMTWQNARKQPSSALVGIDDYHPEHLSNYWMPIPQGVKSVNYKFSAEPAGGWTFQGPYIAKDFAIWSSNTVQQTITTPTIVVTNTPSPVSSKTPTPTTNITSSPIPSVTTISKKSLGDLNNDGRIDISDLSILSQYWGTTYTEGDINGDGKVDIIDLGILATNWMKQV